MRVVAGAVKGRELRFPKGSITRPTTDKVRDAIFNVLGAAVTGATVLDLFAGTGALAIEALSRGAERAELVENNRAALEVIQSNLERTGLKDHATVWPMSVDRALGKLGMRFDLVLADPPYEAAGITELMESLASGELLNGGAIVVLEYGKRFDAADTYGNLIRWQQKRYGDTGVSFYELQ